MVRTFQNVLSILADGLTRSRPAPFVRRIQIILLTITVLTATFLLSYGNLKQQDLDLSPGGPWAEGKNAPASIVASTRTSTSSRDRIIGAACGSVAVRASSSDRATSAKPLSDGIHG